MSDFTFDLTPLADFDANNWAPTKGGFAVQAKSFDRAKRIDVDRVMLTALPTDTNVAGSGSLARCDLCLNVEQSLGQEGSDAWYANSFAFTDDTQFPKRQPYTVFDMHNTGVSSAANLSIVFWGLNDKDPGQLCIQGFGGDPERPFPYGTMLGVNLDRYRKYSFVSHIRWASDESGFVNVDLDGKLVLIHSGPTLYFGQQAYLKLANYFEPDGSGKASSVIHWLPRIGRTREEVV